MRRIAPASLSTSRQRRSSRSSDPRRLSGIASRRSSAEWFHFDPRTAFDPHSRQLKAWYQLLLLALVFQSFLLPYAVVFVAARASDDLSLPLLLQRVEFLVFYALECLFLGDIYIKLNTGFYEDGNMYRDVNRARAKYFTSVGFILDVVALVPLALIVKPSAVQGFSPAWLECHKLVRLWRVRQYFTTLEDLYANFFVALKMTKVVVVTAFVAHVLTCARASFGFRHTTESDNLWLPLQDPSAPPKSSASVYLRSFFWTFGLLTGVFEGELPRHSTEIAFTVLVLLAGFSLFSYLCAVFFVLSKSEHTVKSAMSNARMQQLKHLLRYYHVPENLQVQAIEYVKRYYTDAESNDRAVVQLLCPSIAKDVQVELLRDTVTKIPLFKGCSSQFIVALTSLLQLVSLPADFQLFTAGDPGDSMYVVNSGLLHILVHGVKVRELRKGSFFGEISVFSKRPRSATVVTTSYCTLYKLSRFNIERVLEGYPQFAEIIALAVDTILAKHPASNGSASNTGAARTTTAPSREEFLLTTLFQFPDESESKPVSTDRVAVNKPTAPPARPQKLVHKRSFGDAIPATIKPAMPRRPQIGRSKSAQNVSIARREQLSARSRRSEREKTEGGNSEAPGEGDPADKDNEKEKDKDEDEEEEEISPTHVSRPKLVQRSKSVLGRGAKESTSTPVSPQFQQHRASAAVDAMQHFYDNFSRLLIQKRDNRKHKSQWLAKILLRKPILLRSRFRRVWLVAMQIVLVYNWVLIPLELGFERLRDNIASAWYTQLLNTLADLVMWTDVYVTLNLEVAPTRDEQEQALELPQSAALYVFSWAFAVDLLSILPYWVVTPSSQLPAVFVLLRVPRLVRTWRLRRYWREWRMQRPLPSVENEFIDGIASPSNSWQRVRQVTKMSVGMFLMLHIIACVYFGVTQFEGFAEPIGDVWLPSTKYDRASVPSSVSDPVLIGRQYSHSLFFAATTLTTLGKTFEPASDLEFLVAIACMVLGLLLSALLVDMVHMKFTTATLEQKEFFVTRARIQSFLRSQSAPPDIMQRVNAFLDFWWSSHRGAIAGELLQDLPESIRREIVHAMCLPAVQTLGLLLDVRPVLDKLERVFVDSVDFILYGQGEIVYRQGDYASGLFFLLDGEVCMITDGAAPRSIPKGGFFGTASLHLSETSVSYAERVTAISGCILLYVSRERLHTMHVTFPTLSMALKTLEKRMIVSKLARAHALDSRRASLAVSSADHLRMIAKQTSRSRIERWLAKVLHLDEEGDIVFDPDASSTEVWQVWITVAIVMQTFKVVFEICFGVTSVLLSESVTVLFELGFALDIFFQGRLGYYEYGNKVADPVHTRRRYYRSSAFVFDLIAIAPLFVVNWILSGIAGGTSSRVEILNCNKLIRLLRVTTKLTTLETQNLNRTLELRVLKIVYYTALLAHTLGCIWFSFGFSQSSNSDWLPDARLKTAGGFLQYLSAVFWSYGVMTASATREVPDTPMQSMFSVVTMVCGLGLLSYIVGNLTDVVELSGANSREFNAQLGSLRHLLKHFALPNELQDKLKTYVFFQRFHSITQEHILESCLPPSLLTDIRLVHLQPMIIKVAFLSGMEESVTRMLVSQFSQVLIVKDQFICRYGDQGTDMFFVFTGVVDVLVPAATLHRLSSDSVTAGGAIAAAAKISADNKHGSQRREPGEFRAGLPGPVTFSTSSQSLMTMTTMKKVNELTAGGYLGEVALFANKPRSASARARTSCVLYKLSRRSLELVFERYPEWKKRVLTIVGIQQEQQHLKNLYMAEQQYDENRMKQQQQQRQKQAETAPVVGKSVEKPMSPTRLKEMIAKGSSRLVKRLSSNRVKPDQPLPPPAPRSPAPARPTFPSQITPMAPIDPIAIPISPTTSDLTGAKSPSPGPAAILLPSASNPPRSARVSAQAKQQTPSAVVPELWIDKLLACTEVQSPAHVLWLKVIAVATLFMAAAVPYRIAFDVQFYEDEQGNVVRVILPMVTRILEHVCELCFAWDIWMNWNLKESLSSMELYETQHRVAYQKQRRLLWDVLGAFPIDHFIADFYESPWLRLNRCIKVVNFQHYVDEISRRSVRYEQTRFVSRWMLFLVTMYWCACAYFVIARHTTETPSNHWYQWGPPAELLIDNLNHLGRPNRQLAMRLLRSFFFSVTQFVKKGKTCIPDSEPQLLFSLVVSFAGLLVMAIMIGEIANLYGSYISNEVDFRHHHIAVNKYLDRWHVGPRLRRRAHAFLASLWSSHRGVNYQAILDDLPLEIRNDVVLHVGKASLEAFVSKCLSPFLPGTLSSKTELEALMLSIAEQLRYEGFPRDENVISEGSISMEMYFVVKGLLVSRSSAEVAVTAALVAGGQTNVANLDDSAVFPSREVRIQPGDFFGERGLLGYAVSRYAIKTMRACDLLCLSSEDLLDVLVSRPLFEAALSIAVESYREMTQLLRKQCDSLDADALDAAALLGLNSPDEPWGDVLLQVVEKRQQQWQEQWQHGHITAAYHALLAPMRELRQPDACQRMFHNMLRLILPHGSLYARVASVRNKRTRTDVTDDENSNDFHENLPVMRSTTSMRREQVGWSNISTEPSSGSREMSSPRRTHSRSRGNTPSLSAKMVPKDHE